MVESKRIRRGFSPEFKLEAVRRVLQRQANGISLAQLARELEIRPDLLLTRRVMGLREWFIQPVGKFAPTGSPRSTGGAALLINPTQLTMTRLSTYWCTTLVIALATAPLHGLGAQQIRPAAVANRSDSTVSDTTRQVTPDVAFPPGSRSSHVVNGAIGGAVLGGLYGFIADQRDKSGDGFIAPVVIGAGAIAGVLVGTVVGLLWPTR